MGGKRSFAAVANSPRILAKADIQMATLIDFAEEAAVISAHCSSVLNGNNI